MPRKAAQKLWRACEAVQGTEGMWIGPLGPLRPWRFVAVGPPEPKDAAEVRIDELARANPGRSYVVEEQQ